MNTQNSSSGATTEALMAFSETLAGIVAQVGTATWGVAGRHNRALASAVLWQPGVVVTVAHVFRKIPSSVALVAANGERQQATLVGSDMASDLAVFRLDGEYTAQPPAIDDAINLRAGHVVVAVGRSGRGDISASYGIVNRVSGPWQTWLGASLDQMIRLDGALNDGLSGGAVANAHGKVVGVASAALIRGYGGVIPSASVSRVVAALLADGEVAQPYLGAAVHPVSVDASHPPSNQPEAVVSSVKSPTAGLLLTAVATGGPAQNAGLMVGDILTALDDVALQSLANLRAAMDHKIGRPVALEVIRGGSSTSINLIVGRKPASERHDQRPC